MSYMDFAHKYRIRNMERKMEVNTVTYLGTTVPFMGKDHEDVTMTMSMRDLERLTLNDQMFDEMVAQDLEEESIRESCPAVQAAYEQYQMLLRLAK
jgi:hypothetical protein